MATSSINQYLLDFVRNNATQANEVRINAKNNSFDLYTIYLESLHKDKLDYMADTATLLFVLEGKVLLNIGQDQNTLNKGNLVFVDRDVKYKIGLIENNSLLVKFKMKPGFSLHKLLSDDYQSRQEEKVASIFESALAQQGYCAFKTTSVMQSSLYLKKLLEEYLNGSLFIKQAANYYIKLILIFALRSQLFNASLVDEDGSFGRYSLDEYIDNHYNDINLTETAAHFGFNKNYFSSLVKEKTGKSFVEHVDERRMKEAKKLLASPNVSLEEIIRRVGFSSKSFFYKKFNRYYGMTPLAMRRQLFKEANINLK